MDPRLPYLTVPSLIVLGLLIAHAMRALPRRRAAAFWGTVAVYGVVRAVALRWVVQLGRAVSFPYAMRKPLFPVFGVGLQEVAGWAIAVYLAWWIGSRLSRRAFAQIAWAFVALGSLSWAVESSAVAAGWWSWTIPVTVPFFARVPFIAIVDWAFVALDFLAPFILLTAPAFREKPLRWASLALFPAHFASHVFANAAFGPVPIHHLVHWIEIAGLAWLALRSPSDDAAFEDSSRLPVVALAIVLADVAFVEIVVAKDAALVRSVVPALVLGIAASIATPRRERTAPRWVAAAALAGIAAVAFTVHTAGERRQKALTTGLDAAIAAMNHGDVDGASTRLRQLAEDSPGSHVPHALLGEIDYRKGQLDAAADEFARAVLIKQDFVQGYRYLAVIALRLGHTEEAVREADRGRAIDGADPELRYLAARARGQDPTGDLPLPDVKAAQTLASLAFEVGDAPGAAAILDRGLSLWPQERSFYPTRVRLALSGSDRDGALRWLTEWRRRFPEDAEALQVARGLGAS